MVGGKSRVLAALGLLLALQAPSVAQQPIIDTIRGFRLGETLAQARAHGSAACTDLKPSASIATPLLLLCPAENDPSHLTIVDAFDIDANPPTSFAVIQSSCSKDGRDVFLDQVKRQFNLDQLRPLAPDQLRSNMMKDGVFAGFGLGTRARYLLSSNKVGSCEGSVHSLGLINVEAEQAVADRLSRDTTASPLPAIPGE